jgi:tRNA(Ile)-lysidine synthase
MICKVIQTIEKHLLLDGVKTLAVGVSGGADSMCLLEILSKLKLEYDIILKVIHVNHNIRGEEALRDQKLVEDYCRKIGVECFVYSVDIPSLAKEMGIGEEECGRIKRYESFCEAGCDAIATAHTLSDSIETMIFNLIRGTGVKGLCGIPAKRDNIIRPLIECSRKEIETYCAENDIPYITDSTNLTDDYTRNFIRHNIVASFGKINPNYENAIGSAIGILRQENDFLDQMKNDLLVASEAENCYKLSLLRESDDAVRRRTIADILSVYMEKDVEKRHIDLVDEAVMKNGGKVEISKDFYAVVSEDILSFEFKISEASEWETTENEGEYLTPYGRFRLCVASSAEYGNINAIDADKIVGRLYMSSRKESDRFYSKKRGNTKSLKKLFNEAEIPSYERNKVAILRDKENIIWLDGFGTDGKYLPDINAKNVLIIKKEG